MQPFNFVTMTEYAGRNALELSGKDFPAYATFNQIKANGGKVRKGAHGFHIFCGFRDKLDEKTGKTVSTPRSATVFHINDADIDPGYLAEIKAQSPTPSMTTINERIMTAVLA